LTRSQILKATVSGPISLSLLRYSHTTELEISNLTQIHFSAPLFEFH
jgi:hypothetical protein